MLIIWHHNCHKHFENTCISRLLQKLYCKTKRNLVYRDCSYYIKNLQNTFCAATTNKGVLQKSQFSHIPCVFLYCKIKCIKSMRNGCDLMMLVISIISQTDTKPCQLIDEKQSCRFSASSWTEVLHWNLLIQYNRAVMFG